jgi:1-acyl-sn-glycerol-3-phosphate acyltransferase
MKCWKDCGNIKKNKMTDLNREEKFYLLLRSIVSPVIFLIYRPCILHKENVIEERPTIFAPNHRKTLDPFFVFGALKIPIHWIALKRFFTGADSIFNNSKNKILCWITKTLFQGMGFIPVDREINDIEAFKKIDYYIKEQSNIGIFPEGTTNKNPNKQELGEIHSGMAHFAKQNSCWVQPVSILWNESEEAKNKVAINFREPFRAVGMSKQEITEKWKIEVLIGLDENKKVLYSGK